MRFTVAVKGDANFILQGLELNRADYKVWSVMQEFYSYQITDTDKVHNSFLVASVNLDQHASDAKMQQSQQCTILIHSVKEKGG